MRCSTQVQVQQDSGRFQRVPKGSTGMRCSTQVQVQQDSGRFRKVPPKNAVQYPGPKFNRIREGSGRLPPECGAVPRSKFNRVPEGSEGFQRNAVQYPGASSTGFRKVWVAEKCVAVPRCKFNRVPAVSKGRFHGNAVQYPGLNRVPEGAEGSREMRCSTQVQVQQVREGSTGMWWSTQVQVQQGSERL